MKSPCLNITTTHDRRWYKIVISMNRNRLGTHHWLNVGSKITFSSMKYSMMGRLKCINYTHSHTVLITKAYKTLYNRFNLIALLSRFLSYHRTHFKNTWLDYPGSTNYDRLNTLLNHVIKTSFAVGLSWWWLKKNRDASNSKEMEKGRSWVKFRVNDRKLQAKVSHDVFR